MTLKKLLVLSKVNHLEKLLRCASSHGSRSIHSYSQAVSDTGVIRSEAEINYYVSQVEVISYIESMLLGDPFNFLSNWPTFVWLRRFPSCR